MIKTRVTIIAVTAFVTALAGPKTSDTLTLSDAVKAILKNGASFLAAQAGERAAAEKTNTAQSGYYPSLDATASYANVGPVEKFDFPVSATQTIPFQLYPANNYDIHAHVDYLLWDFGKRKKNVESCRIGDDAAQLKSSTIKTNIAYQAAVLFSLLLIQEHAIVEKEADSAALESHLEFVKRKLETGSATQFDELRTKVQLTNAKTELNNLINDIIKNKIEFSELAGIDNNRPIYLEGSFDSTYRPIRSDSLIVHAMNARLEIQLITDGIKTLELQKDLAKLETAPSVVARGAAGFKNGYISDLDKPTFNWSFGAAFQMPIFDGGKARYHSAELVARIDSLQQVLKDIRRKIRIEVLKAAQDVNSAYSNLLMAKENERLAGEAFRIANLQYEAGTATNLDVLDAQTKYSESKFAHLQSNYRYTLSKYALWQTVGFDFSQLAQ
jgi:outer membrane protein